jgi:hypothetical protein
MRKYFQLMYILGVGLVFCAAGRCRFAANADVVGGEGVRDAAMGGDWGLGRLLFWIGVCTTGFLWADADGFA